MASSPRDHTIEPRQTANDHGSVAEAREALAAWMMRNSYATGHGDTHADLLGELDWQHTQRVNALRVLADGRLRDADAMREAIRAFLSERSRLPPADDASIDAWQARIRATTDALEAAVAEAR